MPTVFAPGAVVGRLRHDEIRRQRDRLAGLLAEVQDLARQRNLVLLEQRLPDGQAERPHEVVRHPAADEQHVRPPRQHAQRVDLARDLGAAENRRERPLGLEQPRQLADLLLEQQAGALLGDELRHADDRGVRAVRGSEGVVHVHVGERRERPSRTPGRSPLRRRGSGGSRAGAPRPSASARRRALRPPDRRSRRRTAPAVPSARRTARRPARARARASACPWLCRGARRR